MKKIVFVTLLCFLMTNNVVAASLNLRDIVNGYYTSEKLSKITPTLDGEHYTKMSADKKCILRYSFKTGELVDTVFNTQTARECNFKTFDGYIVSPDEKRILIQTGTQRIYRRSFTADYYIFTVKNNKLAPLSNNGAQQVPLFSPDGNMIAFVRDNNLFLVKLLFNSSESQITKDGVAGKVLNGVPDWVNEEEFALSRAYDFSADSKMIAFIRYDETEVPVYTMPFYLRNSNNNEDYATYTPSYSYKYPVAGAPNARVTVHTFDIKSMVTRQANLPLKDDSYIPRIKFTKDENLLAVALLNRHQNQLDLYAVNPRSGVSKLLVREENDQYLSEKSYNDIPFYTSSFVLQSERSGHNHLYLYSIGGNLIKQITEGDFEVTDYLGWDEKNNTYYYTSNEGNPLQTAVYKLDAKGNKTLLTTAEGSNQAVFSKDFRYFINTYSNLNTPPVISLYDNSPKEVKEVKTLNDNETLKNRLASVNLPTKELFSFTTPDGTTLNGWMMKPTGFSPSKDYPVILYQYSGPGSQEVKNAWDIGFFEGGLWEAYLTERGFIVACVDGRGTGGRGAEFERYNYMNLGTIEAQDQVAAANYLATLPYIDKKHIGIWGWSYGGYNTLMAMSQGKPTFYAGVAVAPLSDWRFYDSVYGERYMRTPKENGEGYDAASPIKQAGKLNGKLLLIHGTADDNVHLNNTIEYISALIIANKKYSLQLYPDCNHSIYQGENTRYHLFTQIANFFAENLK